MDKKINRQLLPAVGDSSSTPIPSHQSLKRKRSHITRVACNACRSKKTACDGTRPTCTPCQSRRSTCVYQSIDKSETPSMVLKRENESLKQNLTILNELVSSLRYLPEDMARLIFKRLRTTSNPLTILNALRGEIVSILPSDQGATLSSLPSTQFKMVLELMAQHPVAYPALDSTEDDSNLRIPTWLRASTTAMNVSTADDPAADAASSHSVSAAASSSKSKHHTSSFEPHSGAASDTAESSTSVVPIAFDPPVQYSDPRLEKLEISFWTTVEVSNQFAAKVLSLFFETDHWVAGLFDADLFLEDIVSMKLSFCSPFLVNCLLAFASMAYSIDDPEASAKSSQFEKEAIKLSSTETNNNNIMNVAASMLLCLSLAAHGRDTEQTKGHLMKSARMAKKLKLFGVSDALSTETINQMPKEMQKAIAATAWGSFNTVVLQTLFYVTEPPEYPPSLPIPAISITDLSKPSTSPFDAGSQTFSALCSFCATLREILVEYRSKDEARPVSSATALTKYFQLLTLSDNLDKSMTWGAYSPAHVLIFHIYYHTAIIDIFRPFVSQEQQLYFNSWPESAPSPGAIVSASVEQLKRVLLVYRGNGRSIGHSILWHTGLLYVANAVIKDISDPEWRYYFLVCLHNYQDLYPSFPIVEGIVRGLLFLAVSKGAISFSEAKQIHRELCDRGAFPHSEERVSGTFLIDLDLAIVDRDAASIDGLAERFEEITTFDELTEGVL